MQNSAQKLRWGLDFHIHSCMDHFDSSFHHNLVGLCFVTRHLMSDQQILKISDIPYQHMWLSSLATIIFCRKISEKLHFPGNFDYLTAQAFNFTWFSIAWCTQNSVNPCSKKRWRGCYVCELTFSAFDIYVFALPLAHADLAGHAELRASELFPESIVDSRQLYW